MVRGAGRQPVPLAAPDFTRGGIHLQVLGISWWTARDPRIDWCAGNPQQAGDEPVASQAAPTSTRAASEAPGLRRAVDPPNTVVEAHEDPQKHLHQRLNQHQEGGLDATGRQGLSAHPEPAYHAARSSREKLRHAPHQVSAVSLEVFWFLPPRRRPLQAPTQGARQNRCSYKQIAPSRRPPGLRRTDPHRTAFPAGTPGWSPR